MHHDNSLLTALIGHTQDGHNLLFQDFESMIKLIGTIDTATVWTYDQAEPRLLDRKEIMIAIIGEMADKASQLRTAMAKLAFITSADKEFPKADLPKLTSRNMWSDVIGSVTARTLKAVQAYLADLTEVPTEVPVAVGDGCPAEQVDGEPDNNDYW